MRVPLAGRHVKTPHSIPGLRTGVINVSNAQVYGDSRAEWSKIRRVELVRRISTALEDHSKAPRWRCGRP